jgi:outer membrane protein OmpA-like peptidoglycan-associated protein
MNIKLKFLIVMMSLAEFMVAQDINLLEFAKNSDIFNVEVIAANGINTPALEFSPVYFRDGLVFIYANPQRNKVRDKEINSAPFGLYYAPFDKNGLPVNAEVFSQTIISDFHLGPASFNKAQDKLFFSRNDLPKSPASSSSTKRDGSKKAKESIKTVQKLYQADLGPEDWINIDLLPFNSDTFFIFHPTISNDDKRIYFASNMQGGFGETDIYYVEKIGNNWSPPINAGPEVNTAGKEAYPFIHSNGDLYFASNGHAGLGGFDIFVSRPAGRKWGLPINLGAPINSRSDDFGICISPNSHEGFFSSNRSGGKGKDDIYKFKIKLRDDLPYQQTQVICLDKQDRKRLDSVELRLYELIQGGIPNISDPFYVDKHPTSNQLVYKLKDQYQLKDPDRITDHYGASIFELYKNKKYALLVLHPGYIPMVKTIESSTDEIKFELEREIVKRCTWINGLVIDKDTKIQIKDAAISVIEKKNKEGLAFKTNESGIFNVCVLDNLNYEVSISHAAYPPMVFNIKVDVGSLDSVIEKTFELEKVNAFNEKSIVAEGKSIVLNSIYYDYNQYIIRKDATKELDELAAIMIEYSSMEIELIAHTDSRGDWLYNQKLSLQRAISAKDYLIEKGVNEQRVKALGYGESQIRNHCFDGVPCSEEDHQYNRRTEVRIIKLKEKVQVEYENGSFDNQNEKN